MHNRNGKCKVCPENLHEADHLTVTDQNGKIILTY